MDIYNLVTEISVVKTDILEPMFSYEHIKNFSKEKAMSRDLGQCDLITILQFLRLKARCYTIQGINKGAFNDNVVIRSFTKE